MNFRTLKVNIVVVIVLLFTFVASAFAQREGGGGGSRRGGGDMGSSGGGYGVACFDTEETAKAADEFLNADRALPGTLKKKITRLVTLEYWEWEERRPYPLISVGDQTVEQIVDRVHANIRRLSPIFAYRMSQVFPQIRFGAWTANQQLEPARDAHPTRSLTDHPSCRLVPLATRYSSGNNPIGIGPVSRIPRVQVEVDRCDARTANCEENPGLFDLLDPLNKAMLVVHEELYVFGQSIGHPTSDDIRPLVQKIFQMWTELPPAHSYFVRQSRLLRFELVDAFGDYVLYFTEDDRGAWSPLRPIQETHMQVFLRMLADARVIIRACRTRIQAEFDAATSNDQRRRLVYQCQDEAMNPGIAARRLDDVSSFLYMAHFAFEKQLGLMNAEFLLTPARNEREIRESQSVLDQACELLKSPTLPDGRTLPPIYLPLWQKANNYCQSLRPN